MGWVLGALALTSAAVLFVVGVVFEDAGTALFQSLDRVKYSVAWWERILIMPIGVLLVVILYLVTGTLRALTLGVGVLTIVTGELAQRIGGMLPPYSMGSEKMKEVQE